MTDQEKKPDENLEKALTRALELVRAGKIDALAIVCVGSGPRDGMHFCPTMYVCGDEHVEHLVQHSCDFISQLAIRSPNCAGAEAVIVEVKVVNDKEAADAALH